MTFLAIMDWTVGNRVKKYQPCANQAAAEAHVQTHRARFPNAFAVADPGGVLDNLLVDPAARTISVSVPPLTKEQANNSILVGIAAKERVTERRVREVSLKLARLALPANDPDRVALEARETEIVALRGMLQRSTSSLSSTAPAATRRRSRRRAGA